MGSLQSKQQKVPASATARKESEATAQQSSGWRRASKPPPTKSFNSGVVLATAFEIYTAEKVEDKKVLTPEDFAENIFSAIPDAGKLVFEFCSSLISEGKSKDVIDERDYIDGGTKIVDLKTDCAQLAFYIDLFSQGKEDILKSELINLMCLCQQASWLSAGVKYPPVKDIKQNLEPAMKSLFSDNPSVPISDANNWNIKLCPKLVSNLHRFIAACLLNQKTFFAPMVDDSSELIQMCRNGNSMVNLNALWLLTNLLPPNFFPAASSATYVLPLSNIAQVVQNDLWHILYDSNSNGLSISRFQQNVMDYSGFTILLVSFGQYIYALALDCQWKESVKRFGGPDSLCVEIQPCYRLVQSGEELVFFNYSDRSTQKGLHLGRDARSTFLKINEDMSKVKYYGADYGLTKLEVWGCGGRECLMKLRGQLKWEEKEVQKTLNRKMTLVTDWRDNPDKEILDMAGLRTEHSQR